MLEQQLLIPLRQWLGDGSVDFTGYATGVPYVYRYTVPSTCVGEPDLEADVTINLNQATVLGNDNCLGASASFLIQGGQNTATFSEQNMAGECPGVAGATWSGEPVPASWTAATYTADMWYLVSIEISDGSAFFEAIVNSGDYAEGEQLINPVIAGYTGDCLSLVENDTANPTTQTYAVMSQTLTSGTYDFYIRVGSAQDNEGKFIIQFNLTF
jgi:hypothetical protein